LSNRPWHHVVTHDEAGLRLDDVLAVRLPAALGRDFSRSEIRRVIMGGAVRVGATIVRRPGLPLAAGLPIEARIDIGRLALRAEPAAPILGRRDILHQDDDVIAIAKPAGISTHASADPRRPDMVSLVRAYLSAVEPGRSDDAAPSYVGVHQRLDRETSGVLLFARAERANAGLARAFADHAVIKVYHALTVPGQPPARWTLDAPLASSGTGGSARVTASRHGLPARTDCRLLERRRHALLIEARPRTGRRHQVRAHLADAGLPILGDTRYGAPATGQSAAPRVMLHCARLELTHPVTGGPLVLECPWPDDFSRVLERGRERRSGAR